MSMSLRPRYTLFRQLMSRELKNRFHGSLGGYLWLIVHPLILLAIYVVLFQTIFKVRFPELERQPFVAFLAVVLWPWLAFSEGIARATTAITGNAQLVKKVAFPNELLVYAAVTAAFVVHGLGYMLVLTVLWMAGIRWHFDAVGSVMLTWASLYAMAMALGLLGAALQVFVRDFEQALGHGLNVWFYATPVLYPLSLLPQGWQAVLGWNPLTVLMEGLRNPLLFGAALPASLWYTCALCIASWWAARWVFRRLTWQFEVML